jgi:hypothetical protein
MFENILMFLDIKSLQECRTVNSKWDQMVLREIMKRTTLVLAKVPVDEHYLTSMFSSWTLSYQNDVQLINCLSEYGRHLKFLSIKGFPITRQSIECLNSGFISTSCPDLLELCITPLENRSRNDSDNEMKAFLDAYDGNPELATETIHTPFKRFQKDFANIRTLRFEGKWDLDCEPLVHLILMACPSIRHVYMNCYGTRVLKWLAVYSSAITMKLKTFVWKVPKCAGWNTAAYTRNELNCARDFRTLYSYPHLQFSGQLSYLHLDALHFGETSKLKFANRLPLVPFLLNGDTARSVKRLGTTMGVVDLRNDSYTPYKDIMRWTNVSCPSLPNLTKLEMGIRTCYTISLSDVVDALPNLKRLTISAQQSVRRWIESEPNIPENEIWRNVKCDEMKPHLSLEQFITKAGFHSGNVMQQTLIKFPNLKCLEMFGFNDAEMELNQLIHILVEFGTGIRSLTWTKEISSTPLTAVELFQHLAQVKKLNNLDHYNLSCTLWNGWLPEESELEEYARQKENLYSSLLELRRCKLKLRLNIANYKCVPRYDLWYHHLIEAQDSPTFIHEILNYIVENDIPIEIN